MQAALEIAAYAFGFAIVLGIVLAAWLIHDLFFSGAFSEPRPAERRLPLEALEFAREVLGQWESAYERAPEVALHRLAIYLRRLRGRVKRLEQQTVDEQQPYYTAVSQRERAWQHWKTVHDRWRALPRRIRQASQVVLDEARKHYRHAERVAAGEWAWGVVRDRIHAAELRQSWPSSPASLARLMNPPKVFEAIRPSPLAPASPPAPQPPRASPPAEWRQADLLQPGRHKAGHRYADRTFSLADLPEATLVGADLSGCSFANVVFLGTHRYRDVKFASATLAGAAVTRQERPHEFVRCDFSGADFSRARISFALFLGCDLSGSRWGGAQLDRIKFSDCALAGVDWGGADLRLTVFTDEARAADFSSAGAPPLFVAALGRMASHEQAPADPPGPEAAPPQAASPDGAAKGAPVAGEE
jgi:hypothetical protein